MIRLLLALAAALPAAAAVPGYSISGVPGAWPGVLEALGLKLDVASPAVFVIRPGASFPEDLPARVENGLLVVVEANPGAAGALGLATRPATVPSRRELDARAPEVAIIWADAVPVLEAELPRGATIFSKDRWSNIPLMAGWRSGKGAVLWLAAPLPDDGYSRFTFLPQALVALGVPTVSESRRLWAFFDYAYRSRTDPEYMARQWRRMGISALHAAAWHHFEPDPDRDAFLVRLIEACHRHGILVYAWLEYPHVSDRFWLDHPEWRDKTAQLSDASVFWRKLMNFQNPECVKAVKRGTEELLKRFDFDGVNLSELYFESLLGPNDPSQFTPMNSDFRGAFRSAHGFDPASVFDSTSPNFWQISEVALRKLYDFRAELNYGMHQEWLEFLSLIRTRTGDQYALAITTVDDQYEPQVRDYLGYDAARLVKLLDRIDFTYIIQDPAVLWHLGAERYPKIASLYSQLTPRRESMAIDVNVARRQYVAYPTERQAGTEVLQLARATSSNFAQTMYYSEFSISRLDRPLMPVASAAASVRAEGNAIVVESAWGVGLRWSGPAMVDGKPWPFQDDSTVWLTPGQHVVSPRDGAPALRLTDFNGNLRFVEEFEGGISFSYKNAARAIAVLDKKPTTVWIDGAESSPTVLERKDGWTLLLPAGEHWISLAARAK